MKLKIIKIFKLSIYILFFHCGLFNTDKPETPIGQSDVDTFDFMEILRGTVEQFKFEDYKRLFDTTFTYIDPELVDYSKDELLNRLKDIKKKHNNGKDIEVMWFKTDSTTDKFDKKNEVTLNLRGYDMYLDGDSIPAHSGEATFKIRYIDDVTEWVITYWRDSPSSGGAKSYFHPYYSKF